MGTLADLVSLVPPPPFDERFLFDWAAVEAELGTKLPDDYKALAQTYGPGQFDETRIYTPVNDTEVSILTQDPLGLENLTKGAEMLNEFGLLLPEGLRKHDVFDLSAPVRVLEWGRNANCNSGYWLMNSDDPNEWPIIYTHDSSTGDFYTGGIVAFLYGYLTVEFHSDCHYGGPDFEGWEDVPEHVFYPDPYAWIDNPNKRYDDEEEADTGLETDNDFSDGLDAQIETGDEFCDLDDEDDRAITENEDLCLACVDLQTFLRIDLIEPRERIELLTPIELIEPIESEG